MHPQIRSTSPGTCPICKMDLVPVHQHQEENDSMESSIKLNEGSVNQHNKIVTVKETALPIESKFNGIVNYNRNSFKSISSRFSGRIEKLYIKYNLQPIAKGQKMMELYSPEIASAQQELLFVKSSGDTGLFNAAKQKLRLLGLSEIQINQLISTKKVNYRISVYSPYSGFVIEKQAAASMNPPGSSTIKPATSSSMSDGMSSENSASISATPDVTIAQNQPVTLLREGQYISAGERLFETVSLDDVWIEFFLRPADAKQVKLGTKLKVQSDESNNYSMARVKQIQPFFREGINYMLARAEVRNPHNTWKIGQLVDVRTAEYPRNGKWLPKTAVLSLGKKYVVFVKTGNGFKPAEVKVHDFSEQWINIGNSLPENAKVAGNAWFLIDSESLVNVKKL